MDEKLRRIKMFFYISSISWSAMVVDRYKLKKQTAKLIGMVPALSLPPIGLFKRCVCPSVRLSVSVLDA